MNNVLEYVNFALNSNKVGYFVRKQCIEFKKIYLKKHLEAYFCDKTLKKINSILSIITHPDVRKPLIECIDDYAYFFIIAIFCVKYKKDNTRYYQTAILEIGRKNRKTFYNAVIFIIGMLINKEFDRFYSVAPTLDLTRELKLAIEKIIKSSPSIDKHFKIKRDGIHCKINSTQYILLTEKTNNLDGKLARIYLCDECGDMGTYPIEAMSSSQVTESEKLGILISTQYPKDDSGFDIEIEKLKAKLNGETVIDNRIFGLLYEPDEEIKTEWQTNDLVLYQANPLAIINEQMYNALIKKRADAILYPQKRSNYLCKHANIKYKEIDTETFVDIEKFKKCQIKENKEFWKGRKVYIGLDLSMSDDNTSVTMLTLDDDYTIYCKSFAFLPSANITIKSQRENLDYTHMIDKGYAIPCGDEIIDYLFVERFIVDLEKEYGVEIIQIGYDRYNAIATVNRLDELGFTCVEVKQHSSVLNVPTKFLYEQILNGTFKFFENELYVKNYQNAKCVYDTNMNRYVTKKRSNGKVDMVVSTIIAMFLLHQELIYGDEELEVFAI